MSKRSSRQKAKQKARTKAPKVAEADSDSYPHDVSSDETDSQSFHEVSKLDSAPPPPESSNEITWYYTVPFFCPSCRRLVHEHRSIVHPDHHYSHCLGNTILFSLIPNPFRDRPPKLPQFCGLFSDNIPVPEPELQFCGRCKSRISRNEIVHHLIMCGHASLRAFFVPPPTVFTDYLSTIMVRAEFVFLSLLLLYCFFAKYPST